LSKSTRPPSGESSGPASTPDIAAESLDPEEPPSSLDGDSRHSSRDLWTDDHDVHTIDPRERAVKSLRALRTASAGFQHSSRGLFPGNLLTFPAGNGIGERGMIRSPASVGRSPGCAWREGSCVSHSPSPGRRLARGVARSPAVVKGEARGMGRSGDLASCSLEAVGCPGWGTRRERRKTGRERRGMRLGELFDN
jgi:hypothetical protein